jgi:hypothetical protein
MTPSLTRAPNVPGAWPMLQFCSPRSLGGGRDGSPESFSPCWSSIFSLYSRQPAYLGPVACSWASTCLIIKLDSVA